jgi:hypothetical protein
MRLESPMPYLKTILCLANSRKPPSGRCIAGREIVQGGFGNWIRPVSARQTREISEEERRYENGSQPKVLDVIAIQMSGTAPHQHQQENHVIDDAYYWVKRDRISWEALLGAVENLTGPLWLNGYSSTFGLNDRVDEYQLTRLTGSLYLIRPDDLRLVVATEGAQFGDPRRRVRAHFQVAGNSYIVGVTDPMIERDYLAHPDGEYAINEALVCMSLGEVFHGFAYKLAAAVITKQRAS